MPNTKEILNELKWNKKYNLNDAKIWYLHRGASDDTKIISGRDIIKIEKSFIHTSSAVIPFHRIFKIMYRGRIIFERDKK
jgi:uncharacterized protein (UPF0248 family)